MIDQGYRERAWIVQAYKSGFLTIGTLAKKLQKNPIEAFEQLRNTVDVGVRSATGTSQEFIEAGELLRNEKNEAPQLVADITSLITWYDLGIADEIVQIFGRIVVAQSTIDTILDLLLNKRFTMRKGYINLGKKGNTYSAEDITVEHLQKYRAYMQAILSWIQKNCDVLPCDSALNMTAIERKRWYDHYGYDAIDSAFLAKQEKRLLVSEDMCLRYCVKRSFAVKSIWTQPLLEHLVYIKYISSEKYQKFIIQLILANYVHTRIGVYTLEEAAKQSRWEPTAVFERVVRVLGGSYSEEASAMLIVVDFIFQLYSQLFYIADPDPLCFAILDAFVASRDHRTKVAAQLLSRFQERCALFPLQQQEIMSAFHRWCQRLILF